ncbi:hypothetical protein [Filomicrobium sp.]|uniref:hypothetical protein n=1 Tax=Filomicrobium sp. TaxID=2024831 RepID=UPI0025887D18|nr:hypothetical protein [Filomicrobium sp.]MCV0369907.1 hypothetical protein [Filomicrobium sp.]
MPGLWADARGQTVSAGALVRVEKARFVKAANDLLRSVRGTGLPVATYVVVHEAAASARDYGGLAQEDRQLAV